MVTISLFFAEQNIILLGIVATIGTGLATGVGALPVLFTRNVSAHLLDGILGFPAGVMLTAKPFSLRLPSIELGRGTADQVLNFGARFLAVVAIAIDLQNIPEGLAVALPLVREG